jgi:hypothetical protein
MTEIPLAATAISASDSPRAAWFTVGCSEEDARVAPPGSDVVVENDDPDTIASAGRALKASSVAFKRVRIAQF